MTVFDVFTAPRVSFRDAYAPQFENVAPIFAANQRDPRRNRPTLSILSHWIDEMWQALDEFGPSSLPLGRYPFDGPNAFSWDLQTGIPPGTEIPTGSALPRPQFQEAVVAGAQPWVHIDDRFYVLLRTGPTLAFGGPTTGPSFFEIQSLSNLAMAPIKATELGLAYRVIEATIDSLGGWWLALVAAGLATSGTVPPVPLTIWQTLSEGEELPPVSAIELVATFRSWVTGGQHAKAIANFQDPDLHDTAGAGADTGFIAWNVGTLGNPGSDVFARLQVLAIQLWQSAHAPELIPAPPAFNATFLEAAGILATTAGFLAHEMLHLIWSTEGHRSSGNHGTWGAVGEAPLFMPQAVSTYAFRPFVAETFPDDHELQRAEFASVENSLGPSPPAVGGAHPSRHWVTYLFGRYLEAAVKNEQVFGTFLAQHLLWCHHTNGGYRNLYC